MRVETFSLSGFAGKQQQVVFWLPDAQATGIVQITHGMTEHIGRWESLAVALTNMGMIVGGFDLRGHGADVILPGIASFDKDDWKATLEDMHAMFLLLQQRFPDLPHHMLGFSLGSFLLREYLGLYPDGIASAVLLGTGHQPSAVLGIIGALVKTQIHKVGWNDTTPLVQKLSFETYNRKFSPKQTAVDWLCSDPLQVNAYLKDPLCREQVSAGLFWHLLDSMKRCGASDACKCWDKTLPVLLLSGEKDPVGDMGKGVRAVYAQLLRAGIQRVELQLIPDARHDLLHEECIGAADKARKMLCQWFLQPEQSLHNV